MSLDFTKVNYVDGSTIIEADNLNDIQDAILALDNNKVEAESGKGLSTEDYTSAEKAKLSGIETGAQVNPGNATTGADGLMSSVDKAKLDGIAAGATAVTIDSTLTVAGQAADAKATGDALAEKYEKPSGGIPDSDIASASTWNAKGTYSKPSGGIPKTDLDTAVQASLNKADQSVAVDTAIESSLAIVANGDTHAAIASGQYVYIKGHATLAEGLYKATAAIPLNGTLSSTNVSVVSGVLNDMTTIEQIPVTLSSTDTRFKSTSTATCYRCGRIAILEIYSRWDFSATPYDTGTQVVMTVTGAPTTFTDMRSIAFMSTRIFIGWLEASGNVTVRNFSDVTTSSNAPISISFLYLCS